MSMQTQKQIFSGFRGWEIQKILDLIISGESCSVVGVGSVGKSNLMRYFYDNNMQKHLGKDSQKYLFVYVDCNFKLERSDWGLFQLILHRLTRAAKKKKIDSDTLNEIKALKRRAEDLSSSAEKIITVRFLEEAISLLIDDLDLRLILLIDDFDEFCQTISSNAFSILRAIRDDNKYRLMYVVATRAELKELRAESRETEAFYEIVTTNCLPLLSYSRKDANMMLERLNKRYTTNLIKKDQDTIIKLSGGHPGLMRALFDVQREGTTPLNEQVFNHLRVLDECHRMWSGLSQEEQQVLKYIASDVPFEDPEIRARLRFKGLLGGDWVDQTTIFSPIFSAFIRVEEPIAGQKVIVDHDHHIIWVNGRKIDRLSQLEFRFIDYLYQNLGKDCSRDKIAEHLYPKDMASDSNGVSDNRIDSIVKRLRRQVELDPDKPRYILTVRGFGFRLVGSNEVG